MKKNNLQISGSDFFLKTFIFKRNKMREKFFREDLS